MSLFKFVCGIFLWCFTHSAIFAVLLDGQEWKEIKGELQNASPIVIPSHPLTSTEKDRYYKLARDWLSQLDSIDTIMDKSYQLLNASLNSITDSLANPELTKEAKEQIRENSRSIFTNFFQEDLFKKYIKMPYSDRRRAQLYARELAFKLAETGGLQESYQELVLGMALDTLIREQSRVNPASQRTPWLKTTSESTTSETALKVLLDSTGRRLKATSSSAFIPVPANITSWMVELDYYAGHTDNIKETIEHSSIIRRTSARRKILRELNHISSVLDSPVYSDAQKQALRTFYSESLFSHQHRWYLDGFQSDQIFAPHSRLARIMLRRLDSMGLYTLSYRIPKSLTQVIQTGYSKLKQGLYNNCKKAFQ